MLNLFTRKKKELERLQTAYSECYTENCRLKEKVAALKQQVSDLTLHLTGVCLINGALMDVVTEEQKVEARKLVEKKENKLTKKKKGKKHGKSKSA